MFSPNQERVATELTRVCRPGGLIALANWTPESYVGQLFSTLGRYVPPAPGVPSPMRWGTEDGLRNLFGAAAQSLQITPRSFVFRYKSPQHWLEVFRTYYGPTVKAFESLDSERQHALAQEIITLLESHHRGGTGLAVPSTYAEIVVIRS